MLPNRLRGANPCSPMLGQFGVVGQFINELTKPGRVASHSCEGTNDK